MCYMQHYSNVNWELIKSDWEIPLTLGMDELMAPEMNKEGENLLYSGEFY